MAQHLQRVALEFLLKHYSEVQLATALHACNTHSSPHLSHHALNDVSHAERLCHAQFILPLYR